MAFAMPKQPYSGKIGVVSVGSGSSAVKIGGEESYPFHVFEGKMPNAPKIAMEIWDYDPSKEWAAAAVAPFKDVISSPEAWAKKCVEVYGADMIVVQLKSTDPNGMDRSPKEAAQVAKKVTDAVKVPVIFWGTANNQKDEEVLKLIAESCQGRNVGLGPVEEGNHKGVGATSLAYGQTVVASSPIDVNLAKQLNILLGNLGVKPDKIIIDPTTGGLGYGMEYSYSVMERIRMAALTQEDDKLQSPMISNIGNEVWKCKEAGQPAQEAPTLGDPERRAIMMETTAATCYLLAGSDIVILRHPESVRLIRAFIGLMMQGGSAADVKGVSKLLKPEVVDLISISPEPNLDFAPPEGKEKGAKAEKKTPPKAARPEKKEEKAPQADAKKVIDLKAKEEEKAKAEAKRKAEEKAKAEADGKKKAEAEAKARAEAEAKKKAEAEAKARAEAEAKKKAEAEAKARAEAEAKKKAEAEAKAREKQDLEALREKRAKEREAAEAKPVAQKAAVVQADLVQKLIENLDRIHRRI